VESLAFVGSTPTTPTPTNSRAQPEFVSPVPTNLPDEQAQCPDQMSKDKVHSKGEGAGGRGAEGGRANSVFDPWLPVSLAVSGGRERERGERGGGWERKEGGR
jgi:hypothetical protein